MSNLEFAGVKPYMFLGFVARAPRWIGIVGRGFDNRGVLVRLSLPREVAHRLRSEPTLHCYRSEGDEPPAIAGRVRWLM
jgi:hypothetical protein